MLKKTKNAEETQHLAAELLETYPNHQVWLLYGELGAGKTTFVKGLGALLGLEPRQIKSPTFTFVSEYEPLIHYDLYRLEKLDEMMVALLDEHLQTGKRLVIEWPEKIQAHLRIPHLKIRFKHEGGDLREIEVEE